MHTLADVELGEEQFALGLDREMSVTERLGASTGGTYTLELQKVGYTIKIKSEDGKQETDKVILQPTSFTVKPGQMTAVMGASGAGKSTLLDVMAQRIPPKDVEGSILMNGRPVGQDFMRISGYVMQSGVSLLIASSQAGLIGPPVRWFAPSRFYFLSFFACTRCFVPLADRQGDPAVCCPAARPRINVQRRQVAARRGDHHVPQIEQLR